MSKTGVVVQLVEVGTPPGSLTGGITGPVNLISTKVVDRGSLQILPLAPRLVQAVAASLASLQ
jgi:hypothetical protein